VPVRHRPHHPKGGRIRPTDFDPALARSKSEAWAPSTQQELADLVGKVPGAIVAAIDDLEGRGLVARERDAADRRRSRVVLTRKGRTALAKADRLADDALAEVLPGLSAKELETLSITLAKGLNLP
jgi:DNA-binding MarR family transcriptional regulator